MLAQFRQVLIHEHTWKELLHKSKAELEAVSTVLFTDEGAHFLKGINTAVHITQVRKEFARGNLRLEIKFVEVIDKWFLLIVRQCMPG